MRRETASKISIEEFNAKFSRNAFVINQHSTLWFGDMFEVFP